MSTLTPYYVYEANPECDNCENGKSVTTEDFACFHICFISHDRADEENCSQYVFKQIAIEARREAEIKKHKKPKQMELL